MDQAELRIKLEAVVEQAGLREVLLELSALVGEKARKYRDSNSRLSEKLGRAAHNLGTAADRLRD